MTPEEEAKIFGYLGRHLVAIGGVYAYLDASGNPYGQQQGVCFSGFVVEIEGIWYVVTAGHILGDSGKSYGDFIANKQIAITDCKFIDHLGKDSTTETLTTFSWYDICKFHIFDRTLGLDLGVFRLEESHAKSLHSHGVMALGEKNWEIGDSVDTKDFVLIGFPTEEITYKEESGVVTQNARSCFVGITSCPPPPYMPPTTFPRFVGKLNSHEPKNMVGFSGGPIFRHKRENGNLHYWLHAVQSSWYDHDRITLGCPLRFLTEKIRTNPYWKCS
jgi:hypothetical protein